jgi:predicted glycosyltransferase
VLATPGGGEDGAVLLAEFIRASRGAPWDAVVVCGPLASPDDQRTLAAMANEAGAALVSFVPNLSEWFSHADALVCMGGYNTLVEAAAAGVPTVCVPRVSPRTEQLIRARAFGRLGLLCCVEPEHLTPGTLAAAITRALVGDRTGLEARAGEVLHLDGARRAAEHLLGLLDRMPGPALVIP